MSTPDYADLARQILAATQAPLDTLPDFGPADRQPDVEEVLLDVPYAEYGAPLWHGPLSADERLYVFQPGKRPAAGRWFVVRAGRGLIPPQYTDFDVEWRALRDAPAETVRAYTEGARAGLDRTAARVFGEYL